MAYLRIYPNPVSHSFSIETDESKILFTYRLVDLISYTLTQGTLTNTTTDVKADAWPSGMYMVTIYDRDGYSHTYKWVKQ